MNPWRWVDPRIHSLRLESVGRYLASRGWSVKPCGNPGFLRYEGPPGDNRAAAAVQILPASERVGDLVQSLTYAITTLSELEERHPVAILEDMLQFQASSAATTASGL